MTLALFFIVMLNESHTFFLKKGIYFKCNELTETIYLRPKKRLLSMKALFINLCVS